MAKNLARDRDHPADSFEAENPGGLASGFLADEETFDRRALLRLGAWGITSVGAVVVAVLVNHSSMKWHLDQVAALDLARQSQRIQSVAKESQNETRRLASAIDTLNGDRDRLYSRVTTLEQGLDSVTGSISRQNSATASPPAAATVPAPPPVAQSPATIPTPPAAPVAVVIPSAPVTPALEPKPTAPPAAATEDAAPAPSATPATPLMASKSIMAPPDAAAGQLIAPETSPPQIVAATAPVEDADKDATSSDAAASTPPPSPVKRTEFGVDIGGAGSVAGLRALWRGLTRSKSGVPLAGLEPILMVRESPARGLGLQLRLVAGPLSDAAAAARICAVLIENKRSCETTVFDGQRLAVKSVEAPDAAGAGEKNGLTKPATRRRNLTKRVAAEQPASKPEAAGLPSLFGRH